MFEPLKFYCTVIYIKLKMYRIRASSLAARASCLAFDSSFIICSSSSCLFISNCNCFCVFCSSVLSFSYSTVTVDLGVHLKRCRYEMKWPLLSKKSFRYLRIANKNASLYPKVLYLVTAKRMSSDQTAGLRSLAKAVAVCTCFMCRYVRVCFSYL